MVTITKNNNKKTNETRTITWNIIGVALLFLTFVFTFDGFIYRFVNTVDMFIFILWASLILYTYLFFTTLKMLKALQDGQYKVKLKDEEEMKDNDINIVYRDIKKTFRNTTLRLFLLIPFQIYIAYDLVSEIPNGMYALNISSDTTLLLVLNVVSVAHFIYNAFKK